MPKRLRRRRRDRMHHRYLSWNSAWDSVQNRKDRRRAQVAIHTGQLNRLPEPHRHRAKWDCW